MHKILGGVSGGCVSSPFFSWRGFFYDGTMRGRGGRPITNHYSQNQVTNSKYESPPFQLGVHRSFKCMNTKDPLN